MEFITEKTIDLCIAGMEHSQEKNEELLNSFAEQQKDFFSFISGDNFKMLTKEEFDLLLFMAVILWRAMEETVGEFEMIQGSDIESCEEANWEDLNTIGSKKFGDLVDHFFKDYPQEDLLAFVEDSLEIDPDQELEVTQVGKELIFISCKSFIDAAHERYS